jgi:glutamate dehydrogenase/leucine dehydrogenase
MTYKSAVAHTGLGGGKSVVVADAGDKSEALFEAMGRFVADFDGTYITAEDVNVGIPDLRAVRRSTEHVTGLTVEEGGGGNPREATALGVFLESAQRCSGDRQLELAGGPSRSRVSGASASASPATSSKQAHGSSRRT